MVQIADEDELYRRILEYHHDPGTGRIAGSAFMRKAKKPDPEVSVFLAGLSHPGQILRAGLPRQWLVALKARDVRAIGPDVRHEPNEQFPGHCVIVGSGPNWKEQCARLAEASRLVEVPGPGAE